MSLRQLKGNIGLLIWICWVTCSYNGRAALAASLWKLRLLSTLFMRFFCFGGEQLFLHCVGNKRLPVWFSSPQAVVPTLSIIPWTKWIHIDSVYGRKKYIAVIPRFFTIHSLSTTWRWITLLEKSSSKLVHAWAFVCGLCCGGAMCYTWNSSNVIENTLCFTIYPAATGGTRNHRIQWPPGREGKKLRR